MLIRPMREEDWESVLPMVQTMYQSSAVEHPVSTEIMHRAFSDAIGDNPHIVGYLMEEGGNLAGFVYLTFFYSCETGGNVVMIEELFIKESFRGQGIGQKFFDWLYQTYPDAKRYRLDMTHGNPAGHLYERNGFRYLNYDLLICDR